ncbi:cyclic AMP-responsive element-binding protein 3-like protein 2 isoform X1 [Astyanax mexicanus]|uniref:cyclic AMP-responsive element-binding protein 3-like protein 2 isoform X1 n=1 Tax=Astyanax mexicanus TaxID=7994 RepID=UPI0020CAAA9C|nr:cyclic AMP-responsive element-binding protein 3-like protein 2 isoform X1 [Astyanax mexicanus]
MEVLDSSEEPFIQWDRNLSELSEPCDSDSVLYSTHFTNLLDDLSQEALLGQLLSDPFLSGRDEAMEEMIPPSPLPPHIQVEHSYSLSGDSRPQSPMSHLPGDAGSKSGESDMEEWPAEQEEKQLKMEPLLCDSPSLLPTLALTLSPESPAFEPVTITNGPALMLTLPQATQTSTTKTKEDGSSPTPQIKLEPHEVDQFLNLSPKEALQMPPTPPSSHGSDSEGSQSPAHPSAPASPTQTPSVLKVVPRATNTLSNSPLLTAPHKLQGSGPLLLTEEERRTLIAEGYPVPTKLPLSKSEEKALKKIRRKIKNKISAQESRRKKKEYMDALEKNCVCDLSSHRVETCSNENSELRRKMETLENTNKSLMQQLQSLQAVVAGKVPRSCRMAGTQTSTCLMVVVLCFAVFLGSYNGLSPCSSITKTDLSKGQATQESYTATVKSRNLLAYDNHGGLDDVHPSGLGGEYPEWDTKVNIMTTRRLDQKHKQTEWQVAELQPPFNQNNGTNTEPLLVDLHTHRSVEQRSHDSPKVIELERMVNEPS